MNAAHLPPRRRAVVLGGAGAGGMAWMAGLPLALQEAGIALDGAGAAEAGRRQGRAFAPGVQR
jgi:hypothetical protein